ncbi:MAG: hypothetical protein ACT4OP_02035 [Actinomycetota bacterium]
MEALIVIEGIVIVLLAVLVAGLLRSHAEILRQLHALGGGEHDHPTPVAAPRRGGLGSVPLSHLAGPTPEGATATIPLTGSRGYALLAFLSTTCSSCRQLWEGLDAELPLAGARPIVVTRDAIEESPSDLARMASPKVTTLMSSDAWDQFRVPATPHFALVDTSNGAVVGEGAANDWDRVGEMIRRSISDHSHPLHASGRARVADVDDELGAAGIQPGDPRLYQPPAS